MPIVTLQRQFREVGRIRIGQQVAAGNGRKRPAKLETFRITSKSRPVVEAAAEKWGGVVTPWRNGDSDEFEVITTAASLDIIVPPGQPVSQWYEMWSGGGCQRRCDGVTNVLDMTPCACPQDPAERVALAADGKACKPTTRLAVMLPGLPDLGVLRLESHGFYEAVELAGSAELLAMASASGHLIPARLRLDQREKRVPGKATLKYAVPVIEILARLGDLGLPVLQPGETPAQIGSGKPERPAIPATLPPPSSDMRAPAPAAQEVEMSREDFIAALQGFGIAPPFTEALETAARLFPDRDPKAQLTPAERAAIVADLQRDAAGEAAEAVL